MATSIQSGFKKPWEGDWREADARKIKFAAWFLKDSKVEWETFCTWYKSNRERLNLPEIPKRSSFKSAAMASGRGVSETTFVKLAIAIDNWKELPEDFTFAKVADNEEAISYSQRHRRIRHPHIWLGGEEFPEPGVVAPEDAPSTSAVVENPKRRLFLRPAPLIILLCLSIGVVYFGTQSRVPLFSVGVQHQNLPDLPEQTAQQLGSISGSEAYDFLISQGKQFFEVKDYESASVHFRHAMAMSTADTKDVLLAAESCRLRSVHGDYYDALADAQKWLSICFSRCDGQPGMDALVVQIMSEQSMNWLAQGEISKAMTLTRAIRNRIVPKPAGLSQEQLFLVHLNAGRTAYQARYLGEALLSVEAALNCVGDDQLLYEVQARGLRSKIKFILGLPGEAEEDLDFAIEKHETLFPNDRASLNSLYNLRANVRRLNLDGDGASEDIAKCLTWDEQKRIPDEERLVTWKLTRIRFSTPDIAEVDLNYCADWINNHPSQPTLQEDLLLARAEFRLTRWQKTDPEDAIQDLKECLALVEKRAPLDYYRKSEIHMLRGSILKWQGLFSGDLSKKQRLLKDAETSYSLAIEACAQQFPASNFNLARTLAGRARVKQLLGGKHLHEAANDSAKAIELSRLLFTKGQWEQLSLFLGMHADILIDLQDTRGADQALNEALELCEAHPKSSSYLPIKQKLIKYQSRISPDK